MDINVIGGGWVTAADFGRMTDRTGPVLAAGNPVVPPAASIYTHPPVRYRRFDAYARVGCAAIALALKDAGLDHGAAPTPIGIIAATRSGCFDTDRAYYATAKESQGAFASPNLFSFTLPGIVLGEAAIHFRLTGATFTVGDEIGRRGLAALDVAVDLLASGTCRTILAGWLEVHDHRAVGNFTDNDEPQGAVFVVLSAQQPGSAIRRIRRRDFRLYTEAEQEVETIVDLFE